MNCVQKTYVLKERDINKKWYLIDAEGKVLGRVATKVADVLRGKNKPTYSPNLDDGDNIIVINIEKVKLTGAKSQDKNYFHHSQYPGGAKFTNIKKLFAKKPEYILEHAIKGMLPKTKMGRKVFGNLKIYSGSEHPHAAQKPEKLEV